MADNGRNGTAPGGRGPRRNRTKFTPAARARFLQELARLGSINAAAAAAGLLGSTARYHMGADPEFKEEVDAALERHERRLMEQVEKLALEGVREPIMDRQGNQVGERVRYSERMLLAWLRRQEANTWLERAKVEHSGHIRHEHSGRIEVEELTPEQQRRARLLLQSLAGDRGGPTG